MIKYRINTWRTDNPIEKVEVVRETPQFVVYNCQTYSGVRERRESKQGYFNTWKEAHEWLIERAVGNVDLYKKELAYSEQHLERIRNLHED
jgi:hypothetical protein